MYITSIFIRKTTKKKEQKNPLKKYKKNININLIKSTKEKKKETKNEQHIIMMMMHSITQDES